MDCHSIHNACPTRRPLLLLGVAIVSLTTGRAGALAPLQGVPDKYQFKVTVDLVSLNVTVTDIRNRFITDLRREDFTIYEDGTKQDISAFSREDLPLRMLVLLDTSASMEDKMRFAQEAAARFVDTLEEDDLAEVVEFGSKAQVLQRFTNDKVELVRAIRSTQAGGTTALYSALYISLKDLFRRREDVRRQAIVVLSDGEDTSSLITFDQVMELAKATDVTIFTIALRRGSSRRDKNFSEAEHVLKKLAEETGGQWFFPQQLEELVGVYEQIAKELKSQYNVGYMSTNIRRDGSWRRVVVQTDRENLVVRTKLGYYAPRRAIGN